MAASFDRRNGAEAGGVVLARSAPSVVTGGVPSVRKQVIWSVLTQGTITICGVVTAVVLNRSLLPEGRGQVAAVMLWPMILPSLGAAGWANANAWYVSRFPGKARSVWSSTMLAGVVCSIGLLVAGFLLLPFLLRHYQSECVLARWFLVIVPLHIFTMAATSVLEGLGLFNKTLWIRLGATLCTVLLVGTLAWQDLLTTESYLESVVLVALVVSLGSAVMVVRGTSGNWRPEWKERPYFVLRTAPQVWGKTAFNQCDLVLIACLLAPDKAMFGIYVASTAIAQLMMPLAVGVSAVLLPESARRTPESAIQLFLRAAVLYLLLAAGLGLPVGLFAGHILWLAFGEAYVTGAGYLQLSIVYMAAMTLLSFGTATVQGLGRPGIGTIANFVAAVVGVLSALLLLFPMGLYGLILGRLVGCVVGIGVLASFSQRAFCDATTKSEASADWQARHHAAA